MESDIKLIRYGFAFMDESHVERVRQTPIYSYWIFRWKDWFGVGVEVSKDQKFSERFATVRMFTETLFLKLEGVERRFLLLTSSDESSRNEFAKVCESFIELGESNIQRDLLISNPEIWWRTWKSLMGNSIREKMPYDIIGELLTYRNLLRLGKSDVVWNGSRKSTHDLETEEIDYEVKSTIKRYESVINISGQHQLNVTPNKKLYLIFYRFERSLTNGISIDTLVDDLIDEGIERNNLERNLSALGYEDGQTSRSEKFNLLESEKVFSVDPDFPKISENSFIDNRIPLGVIKISYEVDLSILSSLSLSDTLLNQ